MWYQTISLPYHLWVRHCISWAFIIAYALDY
nr:MAG TPA: hypothetical protein [Caudoviricetes sp.]